MKIAFICIHNSCRSQMAEALCKKICKEVGLDLDVYSAGSDISKGINPKAIKILKQKYALDISSYKVKSFDSLPKDLDIVVGMGCGVACPNIEAKFHFDFGLEDPSDFEDKDFIKVVESLELKLKELLEKIIQGEALMLGFIDRFLTLWIFIAMAFGLFLGFIFPNITNFWESFNYNQNNVLLMVCLVLMMYPPLAKVEYKKIFKIFHSFKALMLSLFLNWIFGPILMFILAWVFLKNDLDYMQGIIIIGLARCVAMVVVWSDLARADKEYTAALVGINTIFQILCFAFYVYLFLEFFPSLLSLSFQNNLEIRMDEILKNVAIYLGLPFLLGILSRVIFIGLKGKEWFEQKFLPKISPITLITLLFTIIIMCSYRSSDIFNLPLDVFKICIPLFLYFVIMFYSSWFISKKLGLNYEKNTAISFSASGNNFELAIAISIASFGISSLQSFAAIIGPLIEVPVLILLVKWALKFKY